MARAAGLWTADDLETLPNDGNRYEIVDGELYVTPAPSFDHQDAVKRLLILLDAFVQRHSIGYVYMSPADVSFSTSSVVQPDLFVVPLVNGRRPREWSEVARMLLAVEVISPTTIRRDRVTKRELYQRNEVPDYWAVDLERRIVERWNPRDEAPLVLSDRIIWTPSELHPPLVIDLRAYFAELLDV